MLRSNFNEKKNSTIVLKCTIVLIVLYIIYKIIKKNISQLQVSQNKKKII